MSPIVLPTIAIIIGLGGCSTSGRWHHVSTEVNYEGEGCPPQNYSYAANRRNAGSQFLDLTDDGDIFVEVRDQLNFPIPSQAKIGDKSGDNYRIKSDRYRNSRSNKVEIGGRGYAINVDIGIPDMTITQVTQKTPRCPKGKRRDISKYKCETEVIRYLLFFSKTICKSYR